MSSSIDSCLGTDCKRADLMRRLASVEAERDELREHLQFVERWANHHGQKPHVTPAEALSVIQHYPPIKDITESYSDGKVPETPDPFAERDRLAAEVEALRADAERLDWLAMQCVTVRTPLRYGSSPNFANGPDDNDGETVPWDVRAAIDAARKA